MIRLTQLELFVKFNFEKDGEKMRIDRKKLVIAMMDKNQTVMQLAQKSTVSRVTISSIRSGKSCSMRTAEKLANALGVPVTDILESEV